jgi:AcrR family transcriptional regulator
MPNTTKNRILDSTAELFRRQGYTATGMKQIAAQASAPFGSVYHFFPGGKEELGAEVIRTSGRLYTQLFAAIAIDAPDVLSAVHDFFAGAADTLRDTDYADACPIATVALEVASTSEPLRIATADVFREWIDGATDYFAFAGIARPRASELAFSMLSLLEGAFIFARAMRTTEPIAIAGASAVEAVRKALQEVDSAGAAPDVEAVRKALQEVDSAGAAPDDLRELESEAAPDDLRELESNAAPDGLGEVESAGSAPHALQEVESRAALDSPKEHEPRAALDTLRDTKRGLARDALNETESGAGPAA